MASPCASVSADVSAVDTDAETSAAAIERLEIETVREEGLEIQFLVAQLLQDFERVAEAGQKYQAAIEDRNALYLAWFAALPVVAWATDEEERFVIANAHTLSMLGKYLGADWYGKTVTELFGETAAASVREAKKRASAAGGRATRNVEFGADGSRWDVIRFAFPCCGASGEIRRFHGGLAFLLTDKEGGVN